MKKLKFFLTLTAVVILVNACGEDFITEDPKGSFLEDNYYKNEDQAYSGLVAAYDVMRKQSGGFENMIAMLNAGSDDFYAGGGSSSDGNGIQSFSTYTIAPSTIPTSFWNDFFAGIFRSNVLLSKLPDVPMDEAKKARFAAECKVLRAYYYFELVRTFKNLPLITRPVTQADYFTLLQVPSTEVYAQIEKDLNEALPDLPPTLQLATEAGRFSKGAAQALLGKVLLYEGKNQEAAIQFEQVNGVPGGTSQYGYHLLPNFADLWNPSNKFNSESIIEISHTSQSNAGWGNWGSGSDEGNSLAQMVGPRSFEKLNNGSPDFAGGWSFNPMTQDLYDALKTDPRFDATVADLKALKAAGSANYTPGYMDTGYFLKKFMPLKSDQSTGGGNVELNYSQDTYAMRLADTYLMEAEALNGTGARAQALLDAVRARVGLASVPVSMAAIQNERRLELAGEGHRWFDLVRTGKAATVLAPRGFVAGKNEIWPIPLPELSNTKIVQNPNYN